MKLILVPILVFLIFITPVFSELTVDDLERIRTIVKDEVTSSEKRVKEYVDLKIETVNVKVGEMDKRLNHIFWLVIALIGFVAVVIGVPQILAAARGKEQQRQSERIEQLQMEVGSIKQML